MLDVESGLAEARAGQETWGGPSAHTRELGRVLALAKQVTRQTPG